MPVDVLDGSTNNPFHGFALKIRLKSYMISDSATLSPQEAAEKLATLFSISCGIRACKRRGREGESKIIEKAFLFLPQKSF